MPGKGEREAMLTKFIITQREAEVLLEVAKVSIERDAFAGDHYKQEELARAVRVLGGQVDQTREAQAIGRRQGQHPPTNGVAHP